MLTVAVPPRDTLDPEMRLRVARWLEHHRLKNDWTQRQLAAKLGTSEAHVSRLLAMLKRPDEREELRFVGIDTFIAMREKLHMDLNLVVDGDPPPMPATGPPAEQPPARRYGSNR